MRQEQHSKEMREGEAGEVLILEELGCLQCVQKIQGQVRRGSTLLTLQGSIERGGVHVRGYGADRHR